MGAQHGYGQIVTDGLVLYLNAADSQSYPGSGTTWFDLSGNRLNGTFTQRNTTLSIDYTTDNGGGLIFPGDDPDGNGGTSVRFSDNVNFKQNSQFTIELWLKCDLVSEDEFIVLNGVGTLNGTQHNYVIRKASSKYRLYISDGVNSSTVTSPITPLTTIHQFVTSVDYSSNINFYLNSNLQSTVPSPYPNYLGTQERMEIGGAISGGANIRYFTGIIYKSLLYNRSLTPDEILQNYNATKSRFNL